MRITLLLALLLISPVASAQDMPDLFPNDEPDAIDPIAITDEFWSTGIFTQMMGLIEGTFIDSRWPLFEAALNMLHWLAVLAVVFTFVGIAFSSTAIGGEMVVRESVLSGMFSTLTLIAFSVELISQFPTYTQTWTDGNIWIGLTMSGVVSEALGSTPVTVDQFKDIGFIMLRGLTRLNQPYDYLLTMTSHLGALSVLKTVPIWGPMLVLWGIASVCFAGIGLSVLYAFVKLWLIGAYAIPFLPFIVLRATRRIGLTQLFNVLGAGIRVGSLASIVGLMDGVLNRVTLLDPENITVGTYLMLMLLGIVFLSVAGFVPRKLERLISGPS